MEFKDIVAVSGKPGLYEVVKPRQDGLIVRNLDEDTKSFVSSRKHNFTPLENIGIYEMSGDTLDLRSLFIRIKQNQDSFPNPSESSTEILREYFGQVMPEYDQNMVKMSDIKKILSWYEIIEEHDLIPSDADTSEEE